MEFFFSPFDDDMIRESYSLNFQNNPLLHYYYTHLYGCTYGIHLSHLETYGFCCSFPSSFDVGGTSSHTRINIYIWFKKIILPRNILCSIMMIYIFMGVFMRLLWATWSLHIFFAPYLVQILVEVLHSLLGWKNTWMIIILMNITLF